MEQPVCPDMFKCPKQHYAPPYKCLLRHEPIGRRIWDHEYNALLERNNEQELKIQQLEARIAVLTRPVYGNRYDGSDDENDYWSRRNSSKWNTHASTYTKHLENDSDSIYRGEYPSNTLKINPVTGGTVVDNTTKYAASSFDKSRYYPDTLHSRLTNNLIQTDKSYFDISKGRKSYDVPKIAQFGPEA